MGKRSFSINQCLSKFSLSGIFVSKNVKIDFLRQRFIYTLHLLWQISNENQPLTIRRPFYVFSELHNLIRVSHVAANVGVNKIININGSSSHQPEKEN